MSNGGIYRSFAEIRDKDEKILWLGTPAFVPFILSGMPLFLFGLAWGAFDYFIYIRAKDLPESAIPFFLIHLMPLWIGIFNLFRLLLVHGNTCYAYSDRRIMIRSGFWGTDFKVIDYDKISDLEVTVNPVENLLGLGTIRFFSGRLNSKGRRIYDRFIGIPNPYGVFKHIKETAVDIKTDWNYPNALRPRENPGYKTVYRPRDQRPEQSFPE